MVKPAGWTEKDLEIAPEQGFMMFEVKDIKRQSRYHGLGRLRIQASRIQDNADVVRMQFVSHVTWWHPGGSLERSPHPHVITGCFFGEQAKAEHEGHSFGLATLLSGMRAAAEHDRGTLENKTTLSVWASSSHSARYTFI